VDLDPTTGQRLFQIEAAGVQQGDGISYCYGSDAPQIAVRGDGAVIISEPTNSGFPPLTIVQNGFGEEYPIQVSTSTQNGREIDLNCCMGPPMVNVDGITYVENENRTIVNDVITSDTLYLLQINTDNSLSSTILSTTTENEALLPGPIVPDGQGGVLATWTISPSNPPVPQHPYQAVDVVNGVVGTPYDLPFSPKSVTFGDSPTIVLGENGTAFASGHTTTSDGNNTPVDQVISFNIGSGAPNWSYQAPQGALSVIQATADGGVTINDSDPGVIQISANGTPSLPVSQLEGAVPLSLNSWVSVTTGLLNVLWNANGANGLSTILAQSPFPTSGGNIQGQRQPPFCHRKDSNCALAPHSDTTAPDPFYPGVNRRSVEYEIFSLQNGNLVPEGGQNLGIKIAVLESNPTNPNQLICDGTPGHKCESTGGFYTDDLSVGNGSNNTVKQQFFVDRGEVQVFWPTDGFDPQGFANKTWYGAWDQQVTTTAVQGGVVQQNNPNTQNGATCTSGCSQIQANGTN
jgi:hypothetical protein